MKKLIVGMVVLALAAGAVWMLWLRHRGDAQPPAPIAAAPTPTADPWGNTKASADNERDATPRGLAPRWSLDVDPDGPLRLEGQVVDPAGKGVGSAEIWLSSVPPRSTKSADDGTFAFDKLVGRSYQLTALSGALIGGPVTYKLTAKSDPVVIHLSEGASVVASVVDEAGKPIADADVKVAELTERTIKTDAKGIATLKPIHPGWVVVEATAPGYAPNSATTALGSSGATGTVTITLKKGVEVTGHVLDDNGKPIAKASVVDTNGNPWEFEEHDLHRVVTDDKGAFKFPALAAGKHTLTATDGEHAPAVSAVIPVATDKVSGIEIRMKPGGVIAGVVVDQDNRPVEFATVRVAGSGRLMWQIASRQATTDAKGAFELRGLARTKLQARAESDEAASKLLDADLTDAAMVRDVRLVLDISGTISGIVVDELGEPVPEVGVNAFPDILAGASTDGLALAGMSSATTDGAGAFTIHGLPNGAYRLWAARHTGNDGGWGKQNTGARTGDKAVKIVMPAPGTIVGKLVIDGQTAPPSLATVQVGQQLSTPLTAGAFVVKDLEPGKYDVTFHGAEFAEMIKRDIEVTPGKTTDMGTITVARGRRLTGTVVDASGTPIANAKVKVAEMLFSSGNGDSSDNFDDMAGIRSAVSASDGSFAIIGIPAKATNAMASETTHGQSLAVPIPAGTDDPPPITLALRGFGSITGVVTMSGAPQANVTVSEASKGGGAQASFVQTAADGTFTMSQVTEGTHVLTAMRQQMMTMTTASATVDVVVGKQSTITIDMPVGDVTLTVSVTPQAGAKVDAAQVFLLRGSDNPTTGKLLMDGMFQGATVGMKFWFGSAMPAPAFEQLVPGDYSVCSIPITGDMHDSTFMSRIQENIPTLAVYCLPAKVAAAPVAQAITQALPSMTPLPTPTN